MRYKCVIPMVMDQEAKEREIEKKKEEKEKKEEESLTKDKCINEAEIDESKSRVYQHFKQISQTNKQVESMPKKKKKSNQLTLSQIRGKKRKKQFDIGNEKRRNDSDFSTPTPNFNAGSVQVSKKAKRETREAIEERKVQDSHAPIHGGKNSKTIKSIR